MFKNKQKPIKKQGLWLITSYSDIKNAGSDDEFDPGFIEFEHKETNLSIKKEMAWLRREGAYSDVEPPKLLDIWKLFTQLTPGTTLFVYKNWDITRDRGCFILELVGDDQETYIYKNIISDYSSNQQDFKSFLGMLDNVQLEIDESRKSSVLDIGKERVKRKIT